MLLSVVPKNWIRELETVSKVKVGFNSVSASILIHGVTTFELTFITRSFSATSGSGTWRESIGEVGSNGLLPLTAETESMTPLDSGLNRRQKLLLSLSAL
jgi:hypothetical protein